MIQVGTKPVPKSIAVFGATGHIGRPLARHLRHRDPDIALRLITSAESKRADLQAEFPDAKCVVANLLEPDSLGPALDGVEGIFIVTPSPFPEAVGMPNLVEAVRKVAKPAHIVRITGYEPESLPRRVPEVLQATLGTAQQHYVAKEILDDSDLPVTYLNIGATYIDNFLLAAPAVKARRTMVWPDRLIPFIDPRDVGEIAAELLLSPDERHLYQFHTINNGQDLVTTSQVVDMLGDVLKVKLTHLPGRAAFVAEYDPQFEAMTGVSGIPGLVLDFIEYESGHSSFLTLNDFAERMLGRKPTSLRAWFMEHRALFEE